MAILYFRFFSMFIPYNGKAFCLRVKFKKMSGMMVYVCLYQQHNLREIEFQGQVTKGMSQTYLMFLFTTGSSISCPLTTLTQSTVTHKKMYTFWSIQSVYRREVSDRL